MAAQLAKSNGARVIGIAGAHTMRSPTVKGGRKKKKEKKEKKKKRRNGWKWLELLWMKNLGASVFCFST